MAWARHGHGMASVNQTRPHCVNQMGKTHSKPLAARHGRGKAWARHGHGMLCVNRCALQSALSAIIQTPSRNPNMGRVLVRLYVYLLCNGPFWGRYGSYLEDSPMAPMTCRNKLEIYWHLMRIYFGTCKVGYTRITNNWKCVETGQRCHVCTDVRKFKNTTMLCMQHTHTHHSMRCCHTTA